MRFHLLQLSPAATTLVCLLPLLSTAAPPLTAQDAAAPAAAAAAPKADATPAAPAARIDGTGLGWVTLGEADFANVNCDPDTWSFPNGEIRCTGSPVGVMRTKKEYRNLELVVEWRHLKPAGNSGVFLWASEKKPRIAQTRWPSGRDRGADSRPRVFRKLQEANR